MSDNASVRTNRSVSSLFKRMTRKKPRKQGSSNKDFFSTTSRQEENRRPPVIEEHKKEDIKNEIIKKNEDKKEEIEDKKDKDEEIRKKNEETAGPIVPNYDRNSQNKEPKGVEPRSSIKNKVGVSPAYAAIWQHEEIDLFTDQIYRQYSFWTPNAASLWESLNASHAILSYNEHLRWTCRHYMSFPVTLYYAVLFYIRILVVREYHKQNTETESKFLRRFERSYKFNSLPIAGFLIPFFNAIASYDPNDNRQTYKIPDMRMMFRARTQSTVTDYRLNAGATRMVVPDIPLLYDFWKAYTSATDVAVARYSQDDNFIPHHAAGGDWWLGYSNITDAAPAAAVQLALASWGIDSPHPEQLDKYIEASGYWKNSRFSYSGPAVGALGADNAITTISDFMRMSETFDWFDDCIDMAIIHAKFFQSPRHLSDLDVIQGMEIGLRGTITYTSDHQLDVTQAVTWYNRQLLVPQGTLAWYEEEVMDFQKYNFRHTMTNCAVTVNWSTHSGTARVAQVSRAFTDRGAGNNNARYGPWYERTFNGNALPHHVVTYHGGSSAAFDIFDRRVILIRNNYYLEKPQ